jgi:hypothetical protein
VNVGVGTDPWFGFELNTAVGRPTPKEVVAMATEAAPAVANQKNVAEASETGATTPIGPLARMTLSQYVATVMESESDTALNTGGRPVTRPPSVTGGGSGGAGVETRYVFNTMVQSLLEADFEVPPVLAACAAGTAAGIAGASTSTSDTSTADISTADTATADTSTAGTSTAGTATADTSTDTAGTAGASGAGGAGGAGPAARPFSNCIHPAGKFEFFFGYVCCAALISIALHRL